MASAGVVHLPSATSIDYWTRTRLPDGVLLHILTHCHSDHMRNLNERWPHRIHCSAVTKALVHVLLPRLPRGE